jgi:hypothetical protein
LFGRGDATAECSLGRFFLMRGEDARTWFTMSPHYAIPRENGETVRERSALTAALDETAGAAPAAPESTTPVLPATQASD